MSYFAEKTYYVVVNTEDFRRFRGDERFEEVDMWDLPKLNPPKQNANNEKNGKSLLKHGQD